MECEWLSPFLYNILCTSDWYEDGALMLTDECTVVISGLLMGLNVIDYSVSLTGEDFDRAVSLRFRAWFYIENRRISN